MVVMSIVLPAPIPKDFCPTVFDLEAQPRVFVDTTILFITTGAIFKCSGAVAKKMDSSVYDRFFIVPAIFAFIQNADSKDDQVFASRSAIIQKILSECVE